MKFLKSKSFWLTVAHIAIGGAGVAAGIFFPAAAPIIISTQAMVNGLIPSPVATIAKAPTPAAVKGPNQ
jgi:hypothetical protein